MKFNLKTYKKISGDQHIDSRLKEDHEKAPNEINEKQLEKYRADEPTTLTEKQLEENRKSNKTAEATKVIERQLDTEKGKFDVKLRNSSAYEGDLPKLEEQRLKGDPVENEKYEDASQTPKGLRWWEEAPKSPDGLKLAQKKSVAQKTAQYRELEFTKPRFEETLEEDVSPLEVIDEEAEEELAVHPLEKVKEEYEIEDITELADIPVEEYGDEFSDEVRMYITEERDLPGDMPAVYMVLNFDIEDFNGDESAIKRAALQKVIEQRPELKGIISLDDFGNITEQGAIGRVALRSIDPRLKNLLEDKPPSEEELLAEPPVEGLEGAEEIFEEIEYDIQDMGGTPMANGTIGINIDVTRDNKDKIIDDAIDFISNKYNLDVTEDSLDLSGIEEGEIAFLKEAPVSMEAVASTDFPIIEVTAQNVKKK
jgi:hypothetical protein